MNRKILIVEDEVKLARLLGDYLQREGFETAMLHDGTHAVETILSAEPSLVILDLMLPGYDGLSICRDVRRRSDVPIIMVTARVDDIDRLLGLELGADDYVCKPFNPREVVARVKAILRRVEVQRQVATDAPTRVLTYRGIELDLDRLQCRREGERVELTPVETRLLGTFLEHPGFVYSRDRLMSACYDDHRVVSDRTIDSHVKNLRRKLGSGDAEYIHSVYGVGYKLE